MAEINFRAIKNRGVQFLSVYGLGQTAFSIFQLVGGTTLTAALVRAFSDGVGSLSVWWQVTLYSGIALSWVFITWFTWPLVLRTRKRMLGVVPGDQRITTGLADQKKPAPPAFSIGADASFIITFMGNIRDFQGIQPEWFLLPSEDVRGGPEQLRALAIFSRDNEIEMYPSSIIVRFRSVDTARLQPGVYGLQVWKTNPDDTSPLFIGAVQFR